MKRFARYLWREWIRPLSIPLLLITASKSALADINIVPSGSMQPTILIGDIVFVNKLAYDLKVPFTSIHLAEWSNPARGDVIVCFAPDDGTRLVKRVVGLPGDVIELRQNRLVINGREVTYLPLLTDAAGVRDLPAGEKASSVFASEQLQGHSQAVMGIPSLPAPRDFGPITIPAGSYFVMGDSRDNSRDSRYFGFVERSRVVGKAKGVFVSGDPERYLLPRFDRFFLGIE